MRGKPSPKQMRFILAYVICANAAQAAREAGYSQKSAEDIGRQLLRSPKVAKEIERRQAKLTAKLEVTAEAGLGGIARVAFADAGELFDGDGRLRPIHSLPDNIRMAIAGVDVFSASARTAPSRRSQRSASRQGPKHCTCSARS
jgi:phage terminase small subunit